MSKEEKQKIKLRHRIEYICVRIFELSFRITPYRLCLFNATLLARFAFHVLKWRRKSAEARIKSIFPEADKKEVRRIAYLSIRNIFLNIAELMHLNGVTDKWLEKHVENYNVAMSKIKAVTENSGAILALPHYGNWDLAGIAVSHYGIPIFSVAGIQHNPLTNQWMNNKRAAGITILDRSSLAIRGTLKKLQSKEVFAILPDVRMKTKDLTIDFLGSKANIGRGMALFAKKTSSPILIAKVYRTEISHHYLDISETIMPDKDLPEEEDIQRMTQKVLTIIEKQIRNDPTQWFWYNKRWVLDPIS